MKYAALINWSGGFDSTYVLYNWLKNNPPSTGKKLLVHHCILKNKQGRAKFERNATEQIEKILRDQGLTNWDLVITEFDFKHYPRLVNDIEIIGFLTGCLLRNHEVNSVIISASALDFTLPNYQDRAKRRFDIINAVTENKEIKYEYPIKDTERQQLILSLPKEIRKSVHFCRSPKKNLPCKQCITCKETLPFLKP
jgi:7-cyano-7-deazaguanine synthase in queuosine biosynthesis